MFYLFFSSMSEQAGTLVNMGKTETWKEETGRREKSREWKNRMDHRLSAS